MTVLMEMHREHTSARARLGVPAMSRPRMRRDLIARIPARFMQVEATAIEPVPVVPVVRIVAEPGYGAPINLLDRPSPRTIIKLVSLRYNVSVDALCGRNREKGLVKVRHLAMVLVYDHCKTLSLPTIGRLFDRDHTTVIHALRKHGYYPNRTVIQ